MPTNLSCILSPVFKPLKLTAIFLFLPLFLFTQSLTGLWTGSLSSDSNTIRKDQSFEIALTEYRGKVYGYSRSEFIVNDTLYYILKRVKGSIEGDVCEVTDDDIISYNFRGKLDKGIRVTSTFHRNQSDSTWYLDGTWKTNANRKYYAVTGKVGLQEEKDLNASKIFPHLEELNLSKNVAFYKEFKERKEEPMIARVARPERIKTEYNDRPQPEITSYEIAMVPAKPNLQKAVSGLVPVSSIETAAISKEKEDLVLQHTDKNPVSVYSKTDAINIPASSVDITPAPVIKTITAVKKPEVVAPEKKTIPVARVVVKKEQPVVKTVPQNTKAPVAMVNKPEAGSVAVNNPISEKIESAPVPQPIKAEEKKPTVDVKAKAAVIAGRKSEFSQVVNFTADSLELSLYDNGEIDGDTVSVFMNGEVLMAKQGLKSKAIKKTIYITPGNEEFTLVMFADNLGKYPPNTGLLVVHDGDDVYNLRFSSDLQKSSGIVFRRKK